MEYVFDFVANARKSPFQVVSHTLYQDPHSQLSDTMSNASHSG